MKRKKKYKKALKGIQKALSHRDGLLKPAGYSCNHKPMRKAEFPIGDNDEPLFNISCLLKTCVLALEFIINLLPREQMVSLDKITEILSETDPKKHLPKTL